MRTFVAQACCKSVVGAAHTSVGQALSTLEVERNSVASVVGHTFGGLVCCKLVEEAVHTFAVLASARCTLAEVGRTSVVSAVEHTSGELAWEDTLAQEHTWQSLALEAHTLVDRAS